MSSLARGDRLCGRYTLLAKVGVGGHAEVWRARDSGRRREVALKILRRDLSASSDAWAVLEHEYAVTSLLGHPGILRVYEPVRCEGHSILPMDYARGGDLTRLRGKGYNEVVPALIETAQALAHAHGRGVVHRDLKPGNVLLDGDGHALIADFGVASHAGATPFADHGSPFSASPQALRGEPPAPADDIYGLGTLAYELLTGYPPFYPRFDPRRVFEEPVPPLVPLHAVPPRLVELVMRMLSKHPQGRPHSMQDVIDELHASLHDTLTLVEPSAAATSAAEDVVADPQRAPDLADLPDAADAVDGAEPVDPVDELILDADEADDADDAGDAGDADDADDADDAGDAPDVDDDAASEAIAPAPFDEIPVAPPPAEYRFDEPPPRARSTRYAAFAAGIAVAAAIVAAFVWLPRFAPEVRTPRELPGVSAEPPAREAVPTIAGTRERLEAADARLGLLERRAASVWGGQPYAQGKDALSLAHAALEAGDLDIATERATTAEQRFATVEGAAAAALVAQLEVGDAALAAGHPGPARQAYSRALRIEATSTRASAGLRRAQALEAALPVLAAAANAEAAGDYALAIERYDEILAADRENAFAREGRERAVAASGDASYSRRLAAGFAALRAGELDAARAAFEQAQRMRPGATAPRDGLVQVSAATAATRGDAARERGLQFEAGERWADALELYEDVLAADATLEFARAGRERVAPRAELDRRLQSLIDRPDRLADADVRAEAQTLLEQAHELAPAGPVIRSQVSRLELLLPAWNEPVRVAFESDNLTRITVQRVGPLGAFLRREIELKPGRYTIVGTRVGFRDIRRDITISPGANLQTVTVSCDEPI